MASVLKGLAARYMEVEMLRVLVSAEIGEHARRAVLPLDIRCDLTNDVHERGDDGGISIT